MHHVLRQQQTLDAVEGVGGHAADHVRGVDVFHAHVHVIGVVLLVREVVDHRVLHVHAHVRKALVPVLVGRPLRLSLLRMSHVCLQSGDDDALGNDHHAVALPLDAATHVGQHAVLVVVQVNVHLGDEAAVHVVTGEGRVRYALGVHAGHTGDESRLATHQLHDAHAVLTAHRLGVRALDSMHALLHGSLEAERTVHQGNVVVDGLGNAADRNGDVLRSERIGVRTWF